MTQKPPPAKTSHRQSLARRGEEIAARHLESLGQTVLARNVRTPHGELDLVTRDGEWIVAVEVKTRSNHRFGLPEHAIDGRKRAHLLASTLHYLQKENELDSAWRIDVVAVEVNSDGLTSRIEVFEHAVRAS
jgi:putative endonuclease